MTRVVVISGIDGTGKSTLSGGLQARLEQQGFQARRLYGRPQPLLSRALMELARFTINRSAVHRGTDFEEEKQRQTARPILAAAYIAAFLLDSIPQAWALALRNRGGALDYLVVDRWITDTLATDIAGHLGLSRKRFASLAHVLVALTPRIDVLVILEAPPEIAFERKTDVTDVAYLRVRARYYRELAEQLPAHTFDSRQSPEALLNGVAKIVPAPIRQARVVAHE